MFNTTRSRIPNQMLHKLTEFIPNKMFNTIKLFFIKYWLHIKTRFNLTYVNVRLLYYHISHKLDKSRKFVIPMYCTSSE